MIAPATLPIVAPPLPGPVPDVAIEAVAAMLLDLVERDMAQEADAQGGDGDPH